MIIIITAMKFALLMTVERNIIIPYGNEMADFGSALKTMCFPSPGLRTQSPCSFMFILNHFSGLYQPSLRLANVIP